MDPANNKNKKSYHYQVTLFLRSEISQSFELTAYHLVILRVVADYCDMEKGHCFLNLPDLLKECRISERQFRRCAAYLIEKKLLFKYFKDIK